jgi:hypothetical protein
VIPDGVASIESYAFEDCALTNVVIGMTVTNIGAQAFGCCGWLTAVYFAGDAPNADPSAFATDSSATVYYLPGTAGWGTTFCGLPTAPWWLPKPLILSHSASWGGPSGLAFVISWATNGSVVIEACTNLADASWAPLSTNALSGGVCNFHDPEATNYPRRFYRLGSPL